MKNRKLIDRMDLKNGGGGLHGACVDCCQKLAAPIGLLPRTLVLSLQPFPP